MPKISIIIPCYKPNIELLDKCLASIKSQSFSDYEVIIVDDGNSESILHSIIELTKDDSTVKILSQKNGGVSSARNNGALAANGKYIAFLDADDCLDKSFLSESYELIENNQADMVIGGVVRVNEMGENILKDNYFQTSIFYEKDLFDIHQTDAYEIAVLENDMDSLLPFLIGRATKVKGKGYINKAVHAKLIRKELVQKVSFDETIEIQEDLVWIITLLSHCRKVVIANKVWYSYLDNSASVTNKFDEHIIEKMKSATSWLHQNIDLTNKRLIIAYRYNLLWSLGIISNSLINNKEWNVSDKEKRKTINEIYRSEPWNFLNEEKTYKEEYYKDIIKRICFRLHLFFYLF